MTITYQTIGTSGYGLFLSMIRQGLFYVPFILVLPRLLGVTGIYLTQPAADLLTILVCLCSIRSMKQIASANMNRLPEGDVYKRQHQWRSVSGRAYWPGRSSTAGHI